MQSISEDQTKMIYYESVTFEHLIIFYGSVTAVVGLILVHWHNKKAVGKMTFLLVFQTILKSICIFNTINNNPGC